MDIPHIKPKQTWEELYTKTTQDYEELHRQIKGQSDDFIEFYLKKIKDGSKEDELARAIMILNASMQWTFRVLEQHLKFNYAIRQVVGEYGEAIDKLSKQIELLANSSTNKELTNKILKEHVILKDSLKKVEQKADDARNEIEGFDKHFDDLFRSLANKKNDTSDSDG